MILLSILIPTIPSRLKQFGNLMGELIQQQVKLPEEFKQRVEILADNTKPFLEGGKSIGEKRQYLLTEAKGEYICFLDDDDWVAPNYLEMLVRHCQLNLCINIIEDQIEIKKPDVVCFNTFIKNDYYWALITMSLIHTKNEEVGPIGITERTPWHICPIRAEIAKKHSFDNINHNEDWTWLQKVIPELKTYIFIDCILTQYNHSEKGSEADKILQNGMR